MGNSADIMAKVTANLKKREDAMKKIVTANDIEVITTHGMEEYRAKCEKYHRENRLYHVKFVPGSDIQELVILKEAKVKPVNVPVEKPKPKQPQSQTKSVIKK